jgi:hypothetical protein
VNSVFTYSRPSASPSDWSVATRTSAPPRLLLARAGEHRRELERLVDERRVELRRAAPEHRSIADTPSSRRAGRVASAPPSAVKNGGALIVID